MVMQQEKQKDTWEKKHASKKKKKLAKKQTAGQIEGEKIMFSVVTK